jgi:hypothetical protein
MPAHSLPHHENEYQRSVNDFWSCIIGNLSCELLHTVVNGILAAFIGEGNAVRSLPPSETECQRSLNDIWLCILGYLNGNVWQ